eukprot:11203228-Alexandrium_andersonii.AAC.1
MSASLVGSEMCIRDSLLVVRCRWSALARVCWHRSDSVGHSPRWIGAPVSYTHLTLPTICSV